MLSRFSKVFKLNSNNAANRWCRKRNELSKFNNRCYLVVYVRRGLGLFFTEKLEFPLIHPQAWTFTVAFIITSNFLFVEAWWSQNYLLTFTLIWKCRYRLVPARVISGKRLSFSTVTLGARLNWWKVFIPGLFLLAGVLVYTRCGEWRFFFSFFIFSLPDIRELI